MDVVTDFVSEVELRTPPHEWRAFFNGAVWADMKDLLEEILEFRRQDLERVFRDANGWIVGLPRDHAQVVRGEILQIKEMLGAPRAFVEMAEQQFGVETVNTDDEEDEDA